MCVCTWSKHPIGLVCYSVAAGTKPLLLAEGYSHRRLSPHIHSFWVHYFVLLLLVHWLTYKHITLHIWAWLCGAWQRMEAN